VVGIGVNSVFQDGIRVDLSFRDIRDSTPEKGVIVLTLFVGSSGSTPIFLHAKIKACAESIKFL
jgi:hypothetical protein